MVRGYQRKIVFLKNTGSKMFEHAYFVLSESAEYERISDEDMIAEANRIIEENIYENDEEKQGFFYKIKKAVRKNIIPFFVGGLCSLVISVVIFILI